MTGRPGPVEVSVIIPCRNSTATLGLQLEALAAQAGAPPFEVVIADNRSMDRLEEFIDGWRDRLALRYVDAGRRAGAAFARNVGMSVASGGKWLFCDSDDVVARDWVAQGSTALDVVEVFSGPGLKVTDAELADGLDTAWHRLDAGLPPGQSVHPGVVVPWPILLGGNSGLRREAALAVGGYDAAMSHGVEDNDLAIRVQRSGMTIAAAPGVRILYRGRRDAAAACRGSRVAGEWHMALCQRHGLWSESPHLRGRLWWLEIPRCAMSALRMAVVPSNRDWGGLASRFGLAVGMLRGWWRFRALRRIPAPEVGEGLEALTSSALPVGDPDWPTGGSVLVLSPHLDDALLSASEIIRRGKVEVWTVFAGEPEPPLTTVWDLAAGFTDSRQQMEVRREEDQRAFEGTEATVRHLPFLDGAYTTPQRRYEDVATLRQEIMGWVDTHAEQRPTIVLPACAGVPVSASNIGRARSRSAAHPKPPALDSPLIQILKNVKHRAYSRRRRKAQREGLAINGDHLAVRDLALRVLDGDNRVRLVLVEDLPYLWWHSADAEVAATEVRWSLRAELCSLEVDRRWKWARISHYTSQLEIMDPYSRRLTSSDSLPAHERYWLLTRVPGRRDRD